ncbi:sensor histidine kinase [Cryobacterium psychrophilum]|uniref:Histidine kinase n=1 Tax=Cryobacterium psychrophilum TaxID=41988 RepID=A0A4Y8KJQ9_9MICO|nr:ATP-binding protein [Cryobacterium psychrophilum]TFD74688.1 histidine kinase [Cryobacterium psychrophilum]
MQRILKERDRLLRKSAQAYGLAGSVAVLVCLLIPGGIASGARQGSIVLVLLMAGGQYILGRTGAIRWALLTVACGIGIILLVGLDSPPSVPLNLVEEATLGIVAAVPMSCVAMVLVVSRTRIFVLLGSFSATMAAIIVVVSIHSATPLPLALGITGWLSCTMAGWWIAQSVPRVMHRIAAIGRAHRAERHASEVEAQRRTDARLLHDTVLATLTLLAHSGVGVTPLALRQQSGDDARLLRQLRLGGMPSPRRSGVYTLEATSESTLGTTLESVRQRFVRMGLEVDWHGSGEVRLPADVLDSFLLALGECLENVRRHSGVLHADVTITDDATTVRAMVTDAGVGFDLARVSTERLGVAESVVARLRAVGGNARLFSSPGSGTTVVLEVPK